MVLIILKPNGQAAQAKQLKLNKQSLRIKYFSSHAKGTKHILSELNDIFILDQYYYYIELLQLQVAQ
jgi:hypothetical protein